MCPPKKCCCCGLAPGLMVVIGVWVDVLINVLDAVAIVLRFAVSASYSVYVMSGVEVDLLMDALCSIIRGVLINISVGVLVDVNVNVFARVMTAFGFAISGPQAQAQQEGTREAQVPRGRVLSDT